VPLLWIAEQPGVIAWCLNRGICAQSPMCLGEGITSSFSVHFSTSLPLAIVIATGGAVEAVEGAFVFSKRSQARHHRIPNGERRRLMGAERMAGSNPEFGMAEPTEWITHDHDDLKHMNCMLTRVHWPQDRRVLDYRDRHGILMQAEISAWGGETLHGIGPSPDIDLMENGLK
jgi:hypothetical protein